MKRVFKILAIIFAIVLIAILFVVFRYPTKYKSIIDKYSAEYGVDNSLVASVINIESGYDKNSVSSVGAVGLMQLMPSTAYDVAKRLNLEIEYGDLFDENINIRLGTYYLRYLLDMFDGNEINALSSYNWGLSNVKMWMSYGNINKSGEIENLPVKETENYLKKYKISRFMYKNILNYR